MLLCSLFQMSRLFQTKPSAMTAVTVFYTSPIDCHCAFIAHLHRDKRFCASPSAAAIPIDDSATNLPVPPPPGIECKWSKCLSHAPIYPLQQQTFENLVKRAGGAFVTVEMRNYDGHVPCQRRGEQELKILRAEEDQGQ